MNPLILKTLKTHFFRPRHFSLCQQHIQPDSTELILIVWEFLVSQTRDVLTTREMALSNHTILNWFSGSPLVAFFYQYKIEQWFIRKSHGVLKPGTMRYQKNASKPAAEPSLSIGSLYSNLPFRSQPKSLIQYQL